MKFLKNTSVKSRDYIWRKKNCRNCFFRGFSSLSFILKRVHFFLQMMWLFERDWFRLFDFNYRCISCNLMLGKLILIMLSREDKMYNNRCKNLQNSFFVILWSNYTKNAGDFCWIVWLKFTFSLLTLKRASANILYCNNTRSINLLCF